MCKSASFIVTKTKVLYHPLTDSHEDIIKKYKLNDRGMSPDFVRVEVVPPKNDYSLPLDKWEYSVDQDTLPDWYDPRESEIATREELKNWAKERIFRNKRKEIVQEGGTFIYINCKNVVVKGGDAEFYGNSQGTIAGGYVEFFENSKKIDKR